MTKKSPPPRRHTALRATTTTTTRGEMDFFGEAAEAFVEKKSEKHQAAILRVEVASSKVTVRLREVFLLLDNEFGLHSERADRRVRLEAVCRYLSPEREEDRYLTEAAFSLAFLGAQDKEGELLVEELEFIADGFYEMIVAIVATHKMSPSACKKWLSFNLPLFPRRNELRFQERENMN